MMNGPGAEGGAFLAFVIIVLAAWMYVRILRKAGFNPWWAVVMFIPIVNLVMVWVFAFTEWPADRKRGEMEVEIVPPGR